MEFGICWMAIFGYLTIIAIDKNSCNGELQKTSINGGFASDLFTTIVTNQNAEEKNIIISPLSIQTCIAMVFFGANNRTADEIVTGLHLGTTVKEEIAENFEKLLDNTTMINIANKIYINHNYEIADEFDNIVKKAFHSEAELLDFHNKIDAMQKINDWVELKTNQKIQNFINLNDLSDDIKIFLVNAIYFQGIWFHKFVRITKKEFWLTKNDDEKIDVDMMQKSASYLYGEFPELNMKALEMPYRNSKLSMLIILPDELDGLKELETQFLKNINLLELSQKMTLQDVTVNLPKFKIDFTISLNSILEKMGMVTMFTDAADFKSLFKNDATNVQVSNVYHKAFINVDENGSEAAAATYLSASRASAPMRTKLFNVNHPFLFVIKDNDFVYFIGHIVKL